MMDIIDTFIQAGPGPAGDAPDGLRPLRHQAQQHPAHRPTGEVKVIDFGQSCRIGTVKERIQGTPDYIAPEQVARRPITSQTDVFNLGATLYWALTGQDIPTLYTVNKKGENSFLLDSTHRHAAGAEPAGAAGAVEPGDGVHREQAGEAPGGHGRR